jgi:hypothetical protein
MAKTSSVQLSGMSVAPLNFRHFRHPPFARRETARHRHMFNVKRS